MRSRLIIRTLCVAALLSAMPAKAAGRIDLAALHTAIASDDIKLLQTTTIPASVLNKQDKFGYAPLLIACATDKPEIAALLIDKGAEVNKASLDGKTALMFAADHGHLPLVKKLLSKGARLNVQDKMGYTALFYAAERGHMDILKYLLSKGADPRLKAQHGRTLLMVLAGNAAASREIVALVHRKGVDINAYDSESRLTALSINTMFRGRLEVFNYLLANKADVNWKDGFGRTPLLYTLINREHTKAAALLNNGAKAGEVRYEGLTPLMLAAIQGNKKLAELLISKGAKPGLTDKKGRTALDLAKAKRHKALVSYLGRFADKKTTGQAKRPLRKRRQKTAGKPRQVQERARSGK